MTHFQILFYLFVIVAILLLEYCCFKNFNILVSQILEKTNISFPLTNFL